MKQSFFKYRKIKGKKSGVTLIELIIVIALIGLVLSAAFSMQLFGVKTFKKGEKDSNNQYDVRMAADFITKQLRFASTVKVLNSFPEPKKGYYDIYLKDGKIMYNKNGVESAPIGISNVSDFTLTISEVDKNIIKFKVGKTEDTKYDIESKVSILNIKTTHPYMIEDITSGTRIGIRYTLTEEEISDIEAVEADKSNLEIADINTSIELPKSGPHNTSIKWTSSEPDIISEDGKITRPKTKDVVTILTAKITKGLVSSSKSFTITVKREELSLRVEIESIDKKSFIMHFNKDIKTARYNGTTYNINSNTVKVSVSNPSLNSIDVMITGLDGENKTYRVTYYKNKKYGNWIIE